MTTLQLPNTLSGLLRIAVEDCLKYDALVAAHPDRFAWDMYEYLYLRDDSNPVTTFNGVTAGALAPAPPTCHACMAGAVLAHRKPGTLYTGLRRDTDDALIRALTTIDRLRMGHFEEANRKLHGYERDPDFSEVQRLFTQLADDTTFPPPSGWLAWEDYTLIADALEALGQ